MKSINIFTDGGSRGNPGPAAIGVYIEADGKVVGEIGKRIGVNTNNFAEYSAILEGLDFLIENKDLVGLKTEINFYMDSELAYSQLSGLYRIKNPTIRDLIFKVRSKEAQIKIPVAYNYIPREKNKKADKLVNLALDNKLKLGLDR